MGDLEFVQRCINGDKDAQNELITKYSRLIYNYIHSALRIKGAEAIQENTEDIFQEIFLALFANNFNKLKSFQGRNGCSLASWLRQVVINHTLDYLRRSKPVVSIEEEMGEGLTLKELLPSSASLADDDILREERVIQLKDCIGGLNKEDKYFLELHINRGVRLEDMRKALKLSRGAVDMQKSRILERLRKCFKSKGFALDF